MAKVKSSTNSDKHHYMKGFNFWNSTGAFWRDNALYSEKTKQMYEESLLEMRAKERSLLNLINGKD